MNNKPKRQFKQSSITEDFRSATTLIVGSTKENEFRRNNLLKNANFGIGKAIQKGKHLHFTIGSEQSGLTEYVIMNAKLS